jgi:hypothetical protein
MELKKSYRRIKNIGLLSFFIIVIGTLLVFAQQKNMSTNKKEKLDSKTAVSNDVDNFYGGFRRLSSTKIDTDKENKISAVRRMNMLVDDIDSNGNLVKRKIQMIEIELFSKIMPPVTNAAHFVRIGEREFVPSNRGCELIKNCIMVELYPKEFEQLENNSLITYRIGSPISSKTLKELYKDGEPKEVVGAKFGRLDKTMIDKFPSVERNAVQN